MIAWQSIAIAALSIFGIAACGIGGISIAAGCMTEDFDEAEKAQRGGMQVGTLGLVLVSAAAVVRFL